MFKTNVDQILDILKANPEISVADISKKIGISAEAVQNSAKIMEEEGILKVEYKFMKPYLVLEEKGKKKAKEIDKEDLPPAMKVNDNLLEKQIIPKEEDSQEKEYSMLSGTEIETNAPIQDYESSQDKSKIQADQQNPKPPVQDYTEL
ncbi:winged helix-turn-helix transcriptional regulator, partial [Candidatus Woesearchaeota archaeon]|nr:winged helix-turn-helix transcriptional regulator [Candidatus Woesearchaeota archaeon]